VRTTKRIFCATLILTLSILVTSDNGFGVSHVPSLSARSIEAPTSRNSQAKCAPTKTFTSEEVSFRYSGCWSSRVYAEESTFSTLVDVLSNEVTHHPCRTVTNSRGSQTSCGWPIRHLQRSGVLIEWTLGGQPGWKLGDQKGSKLTVGGRPGREEILQQACGSIGGDERVYVIISRPELDNYLLMTACLRSPDDAVGLQRIRAMLTTVHALR
jgi:hypothetical protein